MAFLRGCETMWWGRWEGTGIGGDGRRSDVTECPVARAWILWILAVCERNIWWEWESECTWESDGGCFSEWIKSCFECSEFWKIQSMTIQIKYSRNSMRLFQRMNHILLWMWWIEEDPINDYSNHILDKLNDVVSWNEQSPVLNVVNWGRSNQWLFKSNTR